MLFCTGLSRIRLIIEYIFSIRGTALDLPFIFDRVSKTVKTPQKNATLANRIDTLFTDLNLEEVVRLTRKTNSEK